MATVRHFGFVGQISGRPTEYLVIFITVQNVAGIAPVVVIVQKFQYFCTFGLNTPILAPFWAVLSVKIGENGNVVHFYPSKNAITRNGHYSAYRGIINSMV